MTPLTYDELSNHRIVDVLRARQGWVFFTNCGPRWGLNQLSVEEQCDQFVEKFGKENVHIDDLAYDEDGKELPKHKAVYLERDFFSLTTQ